MARSVSRHSIFSQRLDRAVFATYFLGGVVPLGALALVVTHWVLPGIEDGPERWGWVAGLVSVGLLSLFLYLALRHITTTAVAQMDGDNQRLQSLLEASRELSDATHPEAVLAATAARVRELGGSAHLAVYFAPGADKALELHGSTDEKGRAWAGRRADAVATLNEEAIASGAPASDGAGVVSVPFARPNGIRGTLVLDATDRPPPDTVDAVATIAGIAGNAIERGDLADSQRNFFAHVTDLLVSALDAHVVGRQGHAMKTARLCNRIGHELGLDGDQKERLHWGAMLHDIGMLKTEPGRHLDMKAVRTHALVGARMVERIRLWEPVAPLVLYHHEWFDGSGYPEGKSGEDIPLEARIIGLADAVDAMSRNDSDRVGLGLSEICEEIAQCAGTQFDPAVVRAFLAVAERGEVEL